MSDRSLAFDANVAMLRRALPRVFAASDDDRFAELLRKIDQRPSNDVRTSRPA